VPPLNTFTRTCLAVAIGRAMIMPVQAANIAVNSPLDVDGDDAVCTLREALTSLNTFSTTATGCVPIGLFGIDDTVYFDSGLSGQTITLSQATALSISTNLTINGLGENLLAIDGSGNAGVFTITSATVILNSLAITGGGEFSSGAIRALSSTISLSNSTVSENYGGGIFANSGSIILSHSTVSGNSRGGVIAYTSSVSLNNSTVSGNYLGGIRATNDSNVSLNNSTVSGNSSRFYGGGICVTQYSSVSLSNTTVSGNSSGDYGGGIWAFTGTVDLSNSTVSGNSAANNGGGIYAFFSSVGLSNSIVAGNVAPTGAEIINSSSTVTANDANLFGDASHVNNAAAFGNFTPGAMDINANSTDGLGIPLVSILSPLANNGGPTQTHALVVGSPALDMGNYAACLAAPVYGLDQRGQSRTVGSVCDIGSFEVQPISIPENIFTDGFEG
jgi:hypothetical protein